MNQFFRNRWLNPFSCNGLVNQFFTHIDLFPIFQFCNILLRVDSWFRKQFMPICTRHVEDASRNSTSDGDQGQESVRFGRQIPMLCLIKCEINIKVSVGPGGFVSYDP